MYKWLNHRCSARSAIDSPNVVKAVETSSVSAWFLKVKLKYKTIEH